MMRTRITLLVLASILYLAYCSQTFDVYRMLQYDRGNSQLGCRRTTLNGPVSHLTSVPAGKIKSNNTSIAYGGESLSFSRSTVIIKLADLLTHNDKSKINSIQTLVSRDDVTGIIIVVPDRESLAKENNEALLKSFSALERSLFLSETPIEKPVYFVFNNAQVEKLCDQIISEKGGDFLPDSHHIIIDASEASPINNILLTNFEATLRGKVQPAPAIAIVAHYDTLSIVPDLTRGLDTNGSGAVALLELARLFQLLYSSASSRGSYDLMFVLTSGGRLNYEGARHWIQKLPHATLDKLSFVLCLESLGSSELTMHVAEKYAEDDVISLLREFTQSAQHHNTKLEFSLKRVDVTSKEIAWEHEVMSRKNIRSATLSRFKKPVSPQISRSSALDVHVDVNILKNNIKMIAEAIANIIYKKESSYTLFKEGLTPSERFIESWLTSFGHFSRSIHEKNQLLITSLKNVLDRLTNQVNVQEFEPRSTTNSIKLYGNTKVKATVYKVKPIWFDLLLWLPIVGYLVLLHVAIVGVSQFKKNLSSLFSK
ncbi:hypothetical protein AKO1_009096 [Acrasis kona]|uniref:BOS complex subunit NCLN n=1 Tax=Acrasis kona TaxID=1008807 RepID=A0AAW2ZHU5_9EUKA